MENYYNLIKNIPLYSPTTNDVELSPSDADTTQTAELFEETSHALAFSIWTHWWNMYANIKQFKGRVQRNATSRPHILRNLMKILATFLNIDKLSLKLLCKKGTSPESLHFLRFTIPATLKQPIWSQMAFSGGQPNF